MEKNGIADAAPPLVSQGPQDLHSQELIEETEWHDDPRSSNDGDKRPNLELSRTMSGPPYTIFGPKAKMFIVMSVAVSSLISPFGAVTFYPALNIVADKLNVTPTLINLSLTTYMVRILDQVCILLRICANANVCRLPRLSLLPLSPEYQIPVAGAYPILFASLFSLQRTLG